MVLGVPIPPGSTFSAMLYTWVNPCHYVAIKFAQQHVLVLDWFHTELPKQKLEGVLIACGDPFESTGTYTLDVRGGGTIVTRMSRAGNFGPVTVGDGDEPGANRVTPRRYDVIGFVACAVSATR
eukprot:scaffold97383_cov48-Attheya_sp.AAC.2